MKHLRAGLAMGTALTAIIALSSCAANEEPAPAATGGESSGAAAEPATGTLNGVGATSQGSAQEAWRAAFQTANPGATVNYDPQGSGAGRTAFINGGADFAGSDSFLDDEELAGEFPLCADGATAIDVPVYISPIAIAFNLPGIDTLNLTPDTVAGIFSGAITEWNADEIAADNEGVDLPDATIGVVRRSDPSGTTENFTEYLSAAAPDVWTEEASDEWPFDTGEGANGTSGVVETITGSENSIGYADFSRTADLGKVSVQVGEDFVAPSAEAASVAIANSPRVEGREENDIAIEIDRTTDTAGDYPVSLISYAIACTDYADDAKGALVKAYLGYITSEDGQSEAADAAGSAPLSGQLATDVATVVESIQ